MAALGIRSRAGDLHLQGQLLVLRAVHAGRVTTRADLSRELLMSRGSTAEITARLRDSRLLLEEAAPHSGQRGRPTSRLLAHPEGPLVCAVVLEHETWTMMVVELGGTVVESDGGRHAGLTAQAALEELRSRITQVRRRWPSRVRAVSLALPGTVSGDRLLQASNLGWRDVDVSAALLGPGEPAGEDGEDPVLLVGNDATLAGLAESRRGAAAGTQVSLHLHIDIGVGGILVVSGQPVTGASGAGGEFGHLPFGDLSRRCLCGARGCWEDEVDARALARLAGHPGPADLRSAEAIVARAVLGDPDAAEAVESVARSFGRGTGGLVNALDPEIVTVSGLAEGLLAAAPATFDEAYTEALMRFRRSRPPEVRVSTLGRQGSLIGASEVAFDRILSELGLASWRSRRS
jgi:predicted NBD/HSP70 family sugar kinase